MINYIRRPRYRKILQKSLIAIRDISYLAGITSFFALFGTTIFKEPINEAIYKDFQTRTATLQTQHYNRLMRKSKELEQKIKEYDQAPRLYDYHNRTSIPISGDYNFIYNVSVALEKLKKIECSLKGYDNWYNFVKANTNLIFQINQPTNQKIYNQKILLGIATPSNEIGLNITPYNEDMITKISNIKLADYYYFCMMSNIIHESAHLALMHCDTVQSTQSKITASTIKFESEADAFRVRFAEDYIKANKKEMQNVRAIVKITTFTYSGMLGKKIEDYSVLAQKVKQIIKICLKTAVYGLILNIGTKLLLLTKLFNIKDNRQKENP